LICVAREASGKRENDLNGREDVQQVRPTLKLKEERTSVISLIAEIDGIEDRLKSLRHKRQGLLQQIRDCRDTQYKLRTERAEAIAESLNGRLHIKVELKGQKRNYKEKLLLLFKGI
jgi:hypothetical protein